MLSQLPFLTRLTLRLATGAERLEPDYRRKIAAFFQSSRDPSGGSVGRRGGVDLYYTSFALRGLGLLGESGDENLERYLRETVARSEQAGFSATEWISLLFCTQLWEASTGRGLPDAEPQRFLRELERFRRDDGGYASLENAAHSSTYHTFLILGLQEFLAPERLPEQERLFAFLQRRQKSDGGFVELEPLKHSGTNPTVAGLGLLTLLRNRQPSSQVDEAIDRGFHFLKQSQLSDGGFQANRRIPVADLLSTFTAVSLFFDLHREKEIDLSAVRNFVHGLERDTQDRLGYVGGTWDDQPDVEYTFYGLATRCLCGRSAVGENYYETGIQAGESELKAVGVKKYAFHG